MLIFVNFCNKREIFISIEKRELIGFQFSFLHEFYLYMKRALTQFLIKVVTPKYQASPVINASFEVLFFPIYTTCVKLLHQANSTYPGVTGLKDFA